MPFLQYANILKSRNFEGFFEAFLRLEPLFVALQRKRLRLVMHPGLGHNVRQGGTND